jgi:hypothetical protein
VATGEGGVFVQKSCHSRQRRALPGALPIRPRRAAGSTGGPAFDYVAKAPAITPVPGPQNDAGAPSKA